MLFSVASTRLPPAVMQVMCMTCTESFHTIFKLKVQRETETEQHGESLASVKYLREVGDVRSLSLVDTHLGNHSEKLLVVERGLVGFIHEVMFCTKNVSFNLGKSTTVLKFPELIQIKVGRC
jgi:hypothetical protein